MQTAAPTGFDNSTVFDRAANVVTRDIVGETIIVPISGNLADMQAIFAVDGVAAFIWEHIDGAKSSLDLHALIMEEFDIGHQRAEEDLEHFISELESAGLILKKQR